MDSRTRFKNRLMRQIDDRLTKISQLNRKMNELVMGDSPDADAKITELSEETRQILSEKRELESIFIGFDTSDNRHYWKTKYKRLRIFD